MDILNIINATAPLSGGLAGAVAYAIAKFYENSSGIKALQAELRIIKQLHEECDKRTKELEDKLFEIIANGKP
jgi:predicted transcriptional regulator